MPNSSNIPMLTSGTTANLRSEPSRNMPSAPARAGQWRYDSRGWTRDLRIDFLRGFVFILLFTSHFSFFSWFSLVGWERLGVISSAEMFILLSGIVTGTIYGKRLKTDGLAECTVKLFKRSWTLYKTAVIAAGIVALLRLVPGLDTTALTTFTDPVTGTAYPMYPPLESGFLANLLSVLVLAATPHEFQIVGLYVALFILTPLLFWAIDRGWSVWLLLISWALYLINYFSPETHPGTAQIVITVARFEYAFPLIAWQVLFVHGVVVGCNRKEVMRFFATIPGQSIIALSVLLTLALMAFSINHPLEQMPSWATLHIVPPATFESLYQGYFLKYRLGPGRILNITVLLISGMALLTVAWRPIHKAIGWLFIPLGQQSMYIFFVHLFLILIVYNTALPQMNNVWLNTSIHALVLLACWVMVKTQFLFRWVPH